MRGREGRQHRGSRVRERQGGRTEARSVQERGKKRQRGEETKMVGRGYCKLQGARVRYSQDSSLLEDLG